MNEEKQIESTKRGSKLADFIGWILLFNGFVFIQNSIIWVLAGDTADKWFTRASIGLICLGFAGIIFKLRK